MAKKRRLLIVQPYVPSYRVQFFRLLRSKLLDNGIELILVAGQPDPHGAMRGDHEVPADVDGLLKVRTASIAGRSVRLRSLPSPLLASGVDLVIVEQALRNVDSFIYLAKNRLGLGAPIAMWGHGRTYSVRQSRVTTILKDWFTRRSCWFFSYTQEGAEYVASKGFDPERITILKNTIDTVELEQAMQGIDGSQLNAFRLEHGLVAGSTALFLGGVDPAKGIDFLLEASAAIHTSIPDFKLLIAGAGSSVNQVLTQQALGAPIVYLGRVDGHARARALLAADVLLIPEWVGLVAVDSLVVGRPIVTTDHHSHSPEFAYLADGYNCVVTPRDTGVYAQEVVNLLRDRARLQRLQQRARADSSGFSLDEMADRFVDGVVLALTMQGNR